MKKLILLSLLIVPILSMAQKPVGGKDAIVKDHIDFSKEYIYFKICGLIEIDGHTFNNDTCSHPIMFKADLDGISIFDDNERTFSRRKCNIYGCGVIHLTVDDKYMLRSNIHLTPYIFNNTTEISK